MPLFSLKDELAPLYVYTKVSFCSMHWVTERDYVSLVFIYVLLNLGTAVRKDIFCRYFEDENSRFGQLSERPFILCFDSQLDGQRNLSCEK